ncbi:MAG TPA: hypothetical protein V6D17_08770 [Candidatus Obscuribacterales bacterium]
MSEYSVSMAVFICFFLAPMVNVAIVPARYMLGQTFLDGVAHRLALSEKRSDAVRNFEKDGSWKNAMAGLGANVKKASLSLVVCGKNQNQRIAMDRNAPVPDDYLPDGKNGPSMYALDLSVEAAIAPIFSTTAGLPGFSKPINLTLHGRSQWENLGRDPDTDKYFLNE